ncbi:PAS domain S-box protein [Algoriphagus aestuariicola]|uniref:histidine kinase n=1 Tax=Algoriphagus aestuariicola TaxID=1852016 RepID=A0ABS3BWL5_9BACT|nr:PAS domain S-box protein [Algoriphagus aestuariicola]MBN7803251.1 PAS domain S-box protein [Algoriphagus aestuariicola]
MKYMPNAQDFPFLAKGGEMGRLIQQTDWNNSPLGPIESWETSLRATLGIVLSCPFPMFLLWGEDLLCFYNDAYRPSLGVEGKHPAIGKKGREVWADIWDFIGPLIDRVIRTGESVSFQDQLVGFYRNGRMEDIYWTFCYSAVFDDSGKINGVVITCTETTDTVVTRRKLEESERRLRSMILRAPVSIAILQGPDYVVEIANNKSLQIWGRSGEEVLGQPILEAMPELKTQGIEAILDEVYSTGKIFSTAELPVQLHRNGKLETAYVNFSCEPLFNSSGEIDGIMAVGIDVTEQVMSRQKILESETLFRAIADNIPNLAWMADADGWIYWYNKKWYEYTGKTPEEMEGWGWQSVHDPNVLDTVLTKWKHSLKKGEPFEMVFPLKGKDGRFRQFLTRVLPLYDEHGKIVQWFGSNTDIEDQKSFRDELEKQVKERTAELLKLNESLKKSEERYHLMVEEVQDYAILYISKEGIVENWNTGAQKIKGYPAAEIIGRSFSNFYTEEDRKRGLPMTLLNKAIEKGKATQEGWRVKKDGSRFWASVVITAVHNDQREIIGFSKVTHDLTEKKEAADALEAKKTELEEKNAELQRMNKELQSFAYISSHDLQEPLRKIQTFASRIIEKEYASLSDKGRELFNRMQRSAEQMQALINDLLAYSRTNTAEHVYQKVSLATVIERIKQDLREELEEKQGEIILKTDVEVNVIHFQFQQMFYNLISNSIKFSRPGTPLRIAVWAERVSGTSIPVKHLPHDRDYWHIQVRDNGIGFEPEYNERIFELFQRLHGKSEYKGTGIGLSIVKKIAENHGGNISASGQPGQGATFDIYLPVERM